MGENHLPVWCRLLKSRVVARCGVTKTLDKSLVNHFLGFRDTQRVTERPPTNIAVGNKQTRQIIQETSPINIIICLKPRASHD